MDKELTIQNVTEEDDICDQDYNLKCFLCDGYDFDCMFYESKRIKRNK